ncbi:SOS response-associated peptidase [Devosia sp. 1566]|uniref:SOS response-associated peptidase n=1 Tax=Devosia sp. 1566 TaxID=2499144 RepID=UPI0020BE8B78|nr:SOS response-associated peptidase [Devosia sp. 1566]
MCGRFTNEMTWADLHALYKLSDELYPIAPSNMQPRYNIAPTQDVQFVHHDKAGNRELDQGRWWLVPFWAKEVPKATMFNARIETIDTSPAFREPFKKRRCLIPADAYIEWTTNPDDGKKDPWLLYLPEHRGFSFAGLWAHNDNLGVTSCTIITAPAVEHIAHIHGRMPVILEEDAYDAWLSGEAQGDEAKGLLLDNQLDSQLQFHRISRAVNNSRYEGTDVKKPLVNPL